MKKAAFYVLLVLAVSACKRGNNSTQTGENSTKHEIVKDTLTIKHGPQFLPVDEAATDTSFLNFRKHLLEAIYKRDEKYLLGALDKNIKIGFGSGDGISNFKKQWQANNYKRLWPVMKLILENGGAFMKDTNHKEMTPRIFMAPYIYANWPDFLDAFSYMAVINNNVNVYEQPATNSKIIAKLNYEIVHLEPFTSKENSREDFIYIKTLDGKVRGYILPGNLYRPVGYRALFSKASGTWKMNALVSGD